MSDQSVNKEVSHLKMKLNCAADSDCFNTSDFTKVDLCKLCSAYDITVSMSMKKEELANTLSSKIKSSDRMLNSNVLTEPEPSTSDTVLSGAKKRGNKTLKLQKQEKEKKRERGDQLLKNRCVAIVILYEKTGGGKE